jgi:chloride channel 3/4/5
VLGFDQGVSTGLVAGFIDVSEMFMTDIRFGYCSEWYLSKRFCCQGDVCSWNNYQAQFVMFITLSASFAVCAALLVNRFANHASGSGIPEVKTILGGFIIRGFLSTKTMVVKMLGLILAVSSGLSLGKEGPLVHLSCCLAFTISRCFDKYRNNEGNTRMILVWKI